MDSWVVYAFRIFPEFLNFFSNLYIPPWLRKSFKFIVLRLLENTFVNLFIFAHAPNKMLPQVLIITPQAEGNYPFPLNSVFWKSFCPQQKGGRIMERKKMTKIKLARAFVTSFDKFYHLCMQPLHFSFLFCCAIIKIRECWRFFNLTNKIFTKKFSVQEYLHERYNLTLPCFLTISPTTICQIKTFILKFFPF